MNRVMEQDSMENKVEKDKLSLIDSLITAMFIPKEYGDLLRLTTGKIVRYILVVVLLASMIQYGIPVLGSIAGLGGMEGILMNEMPEFSLRDGKFYLEEKLETADEQAGIYFLVDTTVKEFTKDDVPENTIQAFMVSESNTLVYNSLYGLGAMVETQSFEDLKDYTITNRTVADMSGLIYAGLAFIFLIVWFATIIEYLMYALFYAIFMFVLMKGVMQDLTFGAVYKVTIFAMTIGTLIEAVTYCLGVEILYVAGGFFNVFVTVILMNKAIIQFRVADSGDNGMI